MTHYLAVCCTSFYTLARVQRFPENLDSNFGAEIAHTPSTMAEARKNRWYVPHLSTLIVLSVVGCGFIVANCHKSTFLVMRGINGIGDVKAECGWPYTVFAGAKKFRYDPGIGFFDSRGYNIGRSDSEVIDSTPVALNFDAHNALCNGGILLGGLLALTLLTETLIIVVNAIANRPKKGDETIVWH